MSYLTKEFRFGLLGLFTATAISISTPAIADPIALSWEPLCIDDSFNPVEKGEGGIVFHVTQHGVDAAPASISQMLESVPVAVRVDKKGYPVELPIAVDAWESVRDPLESLLKALVEGWQQRLEKAEEQTRVPF